MQILFLLSLSIICLNGYSQDFEDKPLTAGNSWIEAKLSKKQVIKKLPKKYKAESKEDGRIEFEYKEGDKTYKLVASFENDEIYALTLFFPIEEKGNFTNEIMNDLGYTFLASDKPQDEGPEIYMKPDDGMKMIILFANTEQNNVMTSIGGKSMPMNQMPNFQ